MMMERVWEDTEYHALFKQSASMSISIDEAYTTALKFAHIN